MLFRSSSSHVSMTLVNKEGYIGVELYISDNKDLYDRLYEQKEEIESKLGVDVEWQRLDGKKASRILHKISGLDFENQSNYNELMNEMIDKAVIFSKVFKKYVS